MALLLDSADRRSSGTTYDAPGPAPTWAVPALAAVATLVRLPFLASPAGADEAGFLQVGAQWTTGGSSLYGSYWVDRPPLLITLFRLAAGAGGLVPLRLLGCLAAAATVLGVAWTAQQIGGRRAAVWSAVAATALSASPLLGALEVNGELLAAPLVALGIGSAVAAVQATSVRHSLGWGALAGAAGFAALLVKQNMADVFVFGLVLLAAGTLRRTLAPRTAAAASTGALLGAIGTGAAVGVWTIAHGTSLRGVYEAMYPFRLHAAQVLAAGGSRFASGRLVRIVLAWLTSGLALATVALIALAGRRREPVILALAATLMFDLVSVALGGGYWLHYLVELIVPGSIGVGVVAARPGRVGSLLPRAAVVLCALSAAGAVTTSVTQPSRSDGQEIGAAIRRVASPNDTLTTLYGEAQVNLAAGLPSPYEYLWSLPTKTLDPHLTALDRVLGGRSAPTWLVTSNHVASWGLKAGTAQAIVDDRYHQVASIDGQSVYLLDGVRRPSPASSPPAGETSRWTPTSRIPRPPSMPSSRCRPMPISFTTAPSEPRR